MTEILVCLSVTCLIHNRCNKQCPQWLVMGDIVIWNMWEHTDSLYCVLQYKAHHFLFASFTIISDISVEHLQQCADLKELHLRGNPLTEETRQRLSEIDNIQIHTSNS